MADTRTQDTKARIETAIEHMKRNGTTHNNHSSIAIAQELLYIREILDEILNEMRYARK